MNQSDPTTNDPGNASQPQNVVPQGNHPLEVAARRGIGPLSNAAGEIWHGHTEPCVSCGQIVLRDAQVCDYCGQELSGEMLEKMQAHAGPWYVLEHVRPFPGVSLDRIIRQARRGLITGTSIVRGPSTNHQWRYAHETPGLCRYLGHCWNCHAEIGPTDSTCRECLSHLTFENPRGFAVRTEGSVTTLSATSLGGNTNRTVPATLAGRLQATEPLPAPRSPSFSNQQSARTRPVDELSLLSVAVGRAELPTHEAVWDEPPRVGGIRATWFIAGLMLVAVITMVLVVSSRNPEAPPRPPASMDAPANLNP